MPPSPNTWVLIVALAQTSTTLGAIMATVGMGGLLGFDTVAEEPVAVANELESQARIRPLHIGHERQRHTTMKSNHVDV